MFRSVQWFPLVMRRASAKLENSFVTANFASAWAQLSKLKRQWVLPPNCSSFPTVNSLTVHQTSALHKTFYFNNTRTKIQLRFDPVNMQPDKTRGVTINQNMEKSYCECKRYAYRIAGAWIDTNDTCSWGKITLKVTQELALRII